MTTSPVMASTVVASAMLASIVLLFLCFVFHKVPNKTACDRSQHTVASKFMSNEGASCAASQ